jgi:hypothetical protein
VPKRNYGFEKRQKELSKQRKKEEKRQRKIDRVKEPTDEQPDDVSAADEGTAEE